MSQNFSLTSRKPPVTILVGDADGGVLERSAEPLLALAHRLLGTLEVGDIDTSAEPFEDFAVPAEDGHAAG